MEGMHIDQILEDHEISLTEIPVSEISHERSYSPSAVMERLTPLLSNSTSTFANRIYSRTYQYDMQCAGREDEVIASQLENLSEEDRVRIASLIGDTKFAMNIESDPLEISRIANDCGNEIANILYPSLEQII